MQQRPVCDVRNIQEEPCLKAAICQLYFSKFQHTCKALQMDLRSVFCFFSKIGRTDTGIGKMQIYIVDCFRLTFDRTFYIKREFGFLFLIV